MSDLGADAWLHFRTAARDRRVALGLTQGALAERLEGLGLEKVTGITVAKIEGGSRRIDLAEAVLLAEALQTTITALLDDQPTVSLDVARLVRAVSEQAGVVADRRDTVGKLGMRLATQQAALKEDEAELERLTRMLEALSPEDVPTFVDLVPDDNASALALARAAVKNAQRSR